jgi:hypothetical protein
MRLHVDVDAGDLGTVLTWIKWKARTDPEWMERQYSARELLHSALRVQVDAVVGDMTTELVMAGIVPDPRLAKLAKPWGSG